MQRHALIPVLLCTIMAAARTSQAAAVLTKSLQPFSVVRVCTPFNVLIEPTPSNGQQYEVLMDADSAVQKALQASVSGKVLSLGASGHFQTSNPIKLTVRLPASELQEVDVVAAVAIQVVVQGTFKPSSLTASNSGVSQLHINGASVQSASLKNTGTGSLVFRGGVGSATVVNSGTGTVYVSGVSKSVTVNLSGLGNAVVDAASDDVTITGQAAGLTKVQYNRGSCDVQSQFGPFFASTCQQGSVSIPSDGVEWSCGLKMDGTFSCTGSHGTIVVDGSTTVINSSGGGSSSSSTSGGSTQTFTSGGGGTFSSQTSSTGGGSAFASSSSSSGPGAFAQQQQSSSIIDSVLGGVRSAAQTGAGGVACSASVQDRIMVTST